MLLTHIVLFKMKDKSREAADNMIGMLRAMEGQIPQLLSIEVGHDVVRSERSYDIGLITKFESLETMKEYQVHPIHQEVLAYINTVRESAIAVDFEN
jgi:hypothetical protein